ncbi:MAG: YraN family protein [Acutalibacteraceae bacterium]|jgi:putative endonuclease|nr:YraN family protein [Acutalibacteraceae bacterium]
MAEKTEKRIAGDIGETYTCDYLVSNGYEIISRNFNCKYGELDIVAVNDRYIAFVEVKTRHQNPMVRPCLAVNKAKQIKIMRTAYIFLKEHNIKLQPRFDISEVYLKRNTNKLYSINYIKNAFIQEAGYEYF